MPTTFVARALAMALAVLAFTTYAADPPARMRVEGPFVLGAADAPVTLVEFSDYECSFCQRYHMQAYERIKREFVDTGKVRYVVRDFPLPMHRHAVTAARAARCAAEDQRFWEMRHALLASEGTLNLDAIVERGESLGLDTAKLRTCATSTRFDNAIRRDLQDARDAGVSLTPSFVLGLSKGDAVEGVRLEGAQDFEYFEERIRALLAAR
ncbi:MAG TPA: thioredoxin domain-containing protein [Usitatibacter sp.]|nr:thioredoxin domain-containing protein [Usitatibacter sp.]